MHPHPVTQQLFSQWVVPILSIPSMTLSSTAETNIFKCLDDDYSSFFYIFLFCKIFFSEEMIWNSTNANIRSTKKSHHKGDYLATVHVHVWIYGHLTGKKRGPYYLRIQLNIRTKLRVFQQSNVCWEFQQSLCLPSQQFPRIRQQITDLFEFRQCIKRGVWKFSILHLNLTQNMSYQTSEALWSKGHQNLISLDAPFPIYRIAVKEL